MKKETIIFALENIARQESLVKKIALTFGADTLDEYYSDRYGIYKNLFGVDTSTFDRETEEKFDNAFWNPMDNDGLDYRLKAELIYENLSSLARSEAKAKELPNEQTYRFEGTLRKVA